MKKSLLITTVVVLAVLALSFVACEPTNPVQMEETCIMIPLDSEIMPDIEGKTLRDYFDVLVEKGFLTYEMDGTMVVTINGRHADGKAKEYWMMYSNDPANTNSTWGTYEYDGVTYGSCTLGLNELPLTEGTTYVFMISQF